MSAQKDHRKVAEALRSAHLRSQTQNSLAVCQLEMQKATPDLDRAYYFAEHALRALGTLCVMSLET